MFSAATHCTELAYLFDVNVLLKPWKRSKDDLRVSNIVTTMWTNFAKYGNPNSVKFDFTWDPVTAETPGRHLLITPKPHMIDKLEDDERVRRLSPLFMAYTDGQDLRKETVNTEL